MIRAENLHFKYGNFEALRGLSFQTKDSKITGLLGPNGSGKSTTFKILSTQISPSQGEAWVQGFSVIQDRQKVREQIGVTFQSPSLDPMLTVQENLEIHATLYKVSKAPERISELLALLRLSERKSSKIKELSGGLARRVELAKTLLPKPKILLLDEPTTGLDPLLRLEFWELLGQARGEGMSVLVTTHLMDEAELCDDLIFLTEGKLAAQGSPLELKKECADDIILLEAPRIEEKISSLKKSLEGISSKVEQKSSHLRIESREALKVLDLLRQEFGSEIRNLNWGKATLADVYLSRTGKALSQ